jgi:hypothetical protein
VPLIPDAIDRPDQANDSSAAAADLRYLVERIEASRVDASQRATMTTTVDVLQVLLVHEDCARTFVLTCAVLEMLAAGEARTPSPAELSTAVTRYGSLRKAADALGIPPTTFRRRLCQNGAHAPSSSRPRPA